MHWSEAKGCERSTAFQGQHINFLKYIYIYKVQYLSSQHAQCGRECCLHQTTQVHVFAFPVKSKEHRLTIAATECVEDALLKKQNKTKGDIITSC